MAVVLDSLSATFKRTVFITPPDMLRELTAMPRAILTFHVDEGVITAKPVNDTQELIIGLSLDTNFAYRMMDLSWSLVQDVAFDWNNRGYLEITGGIRNLAASFTLRNPLVFEDILRVPAAGGEMITLRSPGFVSDMPRYIIQVPPSTPGPVVFTFKATNQTAAVGAAGTTQFFASFLEYDIEQVERFPVHWPGSVLQR